MKTLYLFLTFTLFALSITPFELMGQDNRHINFEEFQLPVIKRIGLDSRFSINGSTNTYRNPALMDFKSSNSGFGENISLNFNQYTNTPHLELNRSMTFNEFFSWSKNKSFENDIKVISFSPAISFNQTARHYRDEKFFELSPDLEYRADIRNLDRLIEETDTRTRNQDYDLTIEIGLGKGRIQFLDDVFTAHFLLNDLNGLGINTNSIDQDDIFELGQLMAEVRNRRLFDFRAKKVYELNQITEFLSDRVGNIANDISFFTAIADNWIYAYTNNRGAGKRWSVGIVPGLEGRKRKQLLGESIISPTEVRNDHNIYSADLSLNYTNQKPINAIRQWDQSYTLNTGYLYGKRETMNDFGNESVSGDAYHLELAANVSHGWFPNTRTSVRLTGNLTYDFIHEIGEDKRHHNIFPRIFLNASYFLTPRMRIEGFFQTYYFRSTNDSHLLGNLFYLSGEAESFAVQGNVTLRYSFF